MIIWIDGTHGVGKSTVTNGLKLRLSDLRPKHLDSDTYTYMLAYGGGVTLQNNIRFLKAFRELIDKIVTDGCNLLIVEMALTQKECKEYLFDILKQKHQIIHIILTASEKTITARINSDSKRDKRLALGHLTKNIAFLNQNYPDAVFINTEGIPITDVCDDILTACKLE